MNYMGLRIGGEVFKVYGAGFHSAPTGTAWHTVKMAAEIDAECTVSIPTPDFDTPPEAVMIRGLKETIIAMYKGRKIFVGCMAGRGRTGLFMACLAKVVFDVEGSRRDPVMYVRDEYYSHAVETAGQANYVDELDVFKLSKLMSALKDKKWLRYLPANWILWLYN